MDAVIGYVVALTLSLLGVAGFAQFAKVGVENVKVASVASSFRLINQAAERYIRDNAAALKGGPGAQPGVQTVTFATLAAGGYVPPGVSPTNAFGQTWEVRVIEPAEDELQAIVVGVPGAGQPVTPTQLASVAATTGFSGGYTPVTGLPGVDTVAQGAFGSWTAACDRPHAFRSSRGSASFSPEQMTP